MSVNDLLEWVVSYQLFIVVYFLSLPIVALVAGLPLPDKDQHDKRRFVNNVYLPINPIVYKVTRSLFSIIIYLSAVPGVFSICLILYSVFLLHQTNVIVSVVIYAWPVLSMLLVLLVVGRKTTFKVLPGIGNLLCCFPFCHHSFSQIIYHNISYKIDGFTALSS